MSISDNLCMGCMNPLPEGRAECEICGYPVNGDNPAPYLPVRTLLSDRYLVGRALDNTGDAAVYIGFDQVLKTPIIIREFLPDTLCEREENNELRVISGCENTFRDYHEKFGNHARALARLRDLPAIVSPYDIFRQNNTTYTISEYSEGLSLESRLAQVGGRLRWEEARPLFMPLMGSLVSLHAAGIVHLGICPEKLQVGTDGKLRLSDFSIQEARVVNTDLKPHLNQGYSAPEQYNFEQECGAAADVYGLAATIFRTLTGNPPPAGPNRSLDSNDLFVPANVARDLPDHVAAALFNALQVPQEKRTPTMAAFRDQLAAAPAVTELMREEPVAPPPAPTPVPPAEPEEDEEEEEKPRKKNNRVKVAVLIVAAVFVLLLLLAFTVLMMVFPEIFGGGEQSSVPQTSLPSFSFSSSSSEASVVSTEEQFAVPDLRNKNYYELMGETLNGNMKLQVAYKAYSDQPKGTILQQDPSPENLTSEGATIQVVISDGPEEITIPDLRGWEADKAQMLLEAMGFRVEVVELLISDMPKGQVQETNPPAGEKRKEGEVIELRVSAVESTTVPTTDNTTVNTGTTTTTPRMGADERE